MGIKQEMTVAATIVGAGAGGIMQANDSLNMLNIASGYISGATVTLIGVGIVYGGKKLGEKISDVFELSSRSVKRSVLETGTQISAGAGSSTAVLLMVDGSTVENALTSGFAVAAAPAVITAFVSTISWAGKKAANAVGDFLDRGMGH